MAIYRLGESSIQRLEETTFSDEGIRERQDLQQLLKDSIDVIAPDTMVIAEEFGEWTDSNRRIDLLAIDRTANLVVIELKRTLDGGHMELQAIRYAAMISTMTFRRAVEVYADFANTDSLAAAEEDILKFLEWDAPSEEDFSNEIRIVLASGEFSREITTSVLWLNEQGLDIKCIRMKPYRANGEILINIEQVIPLPEAEEFQIGVRGKRERQRRERVSNRDTARRDMVIEGRSFTALPKRRIIYEVVAAALAKGADIEEIRESMPNPKWYSVNGELDGDAFVDAAIETKEQEGGIFRPGKFFVLTEELFHANGRTYALSNQWGKRTQGHVSRLEKQYNLDIEVSW